MCCVVEIEIDKVEIEIEIIPVIDYTTICSR